MITCKRIICMNWDTVFHLHLRGLLGTLVSVQMSCRDKHDIRWWRMVNNCRKQEAVGNGEEKNAVVGGDKTCVWLDPSYSVSFMTVFWCGHSVDYAKLMVWHSCSRKRRRCHSFCGRFQLTYSPIAGFPIHLSNSRRFSWGNSCCLISICNEVFTTKAIYTFQTNNARKVDRKCLSCKNVEGSSRFSYASAT